MSRDDDAVDAAIQRLEAAVDSGPPLHMTHALVTDLRTVIAAAKRPPLTDATRERLADVLDEATSKFGTGFWATAERDALVEAILAEYAPGASTRERLAEALREWLQSRGMVFVSNETANEGADRLLASDAVEDRTEVFQAGHDAGYQEGYDRSAEDRAEVAAKALEAWADYLEDGADSLHRAIARSARARAASIRERRA